MNAEVAVTAEGDILFQFILLHLLLSIDFVALNILSLPAGNAISACMYVSRLEEAKCEMDTVDRHVYYMFKCFWSS